MGKFEIDKFTATPNMTVVELMKKIDDNSRGVLFIVSDEDILVGTLTDGDIRRWIIKTGDLEGKASNIMNSNPVCVYEKDIADAYDIMNKKRVNCIAVKSDDNKIVDVLFLDNNVNQYSYINPSALESIPVVVMAGGKGTRLYPYTKILPKPLIPIGDVPILERIFNRFSRYGVNNFYLTVNYKKEMIKSHFIELQPEYGIQYIEENKPLGTAGSIKLIDEKFSSPIIVTNCDILIEADYGEILDFHNKSGNSMTIVSSLKNITVPYGVLHSMEDGIVLSLEEKPQLSYFINTGMYIINPACIEKIPMDTFFHMTDLADVLLKDGQKVGMYPISENSFLDMGQIEEMQKMEERVKNGTIM